MRRKLPPLVQFARESITWRQLLFNRITALLIAVVVISIAMQGYVAANNDGVIKGTAVDTDGTPIENATVYLEEENRLGQNPTHETTTNANGEYLFDGMTEMVELRISAEAPDGAYSEPIREHLYFQGQNTEIDIVVDQYE